MRDVLTKLARTMLGLPVCLIFLVLAMPSTMLAIWIVSPDEVAECWESCPFRPIRFLEQVW